MNAPIDITGITLRTPRMTLRPWREADAASIARYADNAKIAANLRDVFPCPYAPQDAATFVESCIRQEGRG
mgnify:CR=1 FL=1